MRDPGCAPMEMALCTTGGLVCMGLMLEPCGTVMALVVLSLAVWASVRRPEPHR